MNVVLTRERPRNDTLRKIMNNEAAMKAVMNIEGFRALGSDIFETVVNKSEAVKDTKRTKGEDLKYWKDQFDSQVNSNDPRRGSSDAMPNKTVKIDSVVLTELEHHANLIPWQLVTAEKDARLEFIPFDEQGRLDQAVYATLLAARPRLVAFTAVVGGVGNGFVWSLVAVYGVFALAHVWVLLARPRRFG